MDPIEGGEGQDYAGALELMRRQGVNVELLAGSLNLQGGTRGPEHRDFPLGRAVEEPRTNVMSVLDRILGHNGENTEF